MSECIVKIREIEDVSAHPYADLLDVVTLEGWSCVVPKGQYSAGDKVLYIPIDSILPVELSDKYDITKYLSNQRVRAIRLRGIPSFGLVLPNEGYEEGVNLAPSLNIIKYEPPEKLAIGDAAPENPLIPVYTEIENMRNFIHVFEEGEPVVITEKIHGTNCRLGLTWDPDNKFKWFAGSHKVMRKEGSLYWKPLSVPGVREMMEAAIRPLSSSCEEESFLPSVVVYCEIYGPGIQSLNYDLKSVDFRVFDILLSSGNFLWPSALKFACKEYDVKTVPVLYEGPFSLDIVKELSNGKSSIASHIREGVVVRPVKEEWHSEIGRKILKYVGDDYLTSKNKRREQE